MNYLKGTTLRQKQISEAKKQLRLLHDKLDNWMKENDN